MQTWHDYEATTEHSAVHKHTTTMTAGALVAAQSRKTEEFIAADDTVTFEQESIWNGTEWLLLSTTAYEYDAQQRVVKTTRGNGRFYTSTWMCCGKLSETDEDGITTTYGYNSAHELVESIRAEVKDGEVVVTPETITAYTYSPYGQVSSTGDVEQPIQWSSEYNDTELGLVYYNYRHYNPQVGFIPEYNFSPNVAKIGQDLFDLHNK